MWATGFRQVFDWIHLPILGDDGWPKEMRGRGRRRPGPVLLRAGFQYSFSSMLIAGVGRDAAFVADRMATRSRALGKATSSHPAAA